MNHRERVLTALQHKEPDRVPIDFGGTVDSSIVVPAYAQLREHLKLGTEGIRVPEVAVQVVLISDEVRRAMGSDVWGIFYEPRSWRTDVLTYGYPIEVPASFQPLVREDGSQVVLDPAGKVMLRMPKGGYYFDLVVPPLADVTSVDDLDKHRGDIEAFDRPHYLDKSFEELARQAKALRENTDYLLVGFFGGHILQAGQLLRGFEGFLMDLVSNRKLAEALMDRVLETHMRRFERFAETVGKYLDVIQVEDDLGMQDRTLISPATYRQVVKPYHQRLYAYIKEECAARLLLHSCGSVYPLIPDFIEMGVDALNPVQVSAKDMDTKELKREFGQDICFWGGGCDTQRVLPYGTPQQVRDEVKRRIDDLAAGGGYVFTQVHNIQPNVPAKNVVAMFETAREYGVYK